MVKTSSKQRLLSQEEIIGLCNRKRAIFINCLSGFKSANLLGTQDSEGKTNLCIVSSVVHLGASPALIGLVIRPDSLARDTLDNIIETKSFTINHVHRNILERAHQTSARYPKEQSEFQACHLLPEYLNGFMAPYVSESKIKFAVELVRVEKIPENGTNFVIGQIVDVHFPTDCWDADGSLDIGKAGTVTVSGLDSYHECDEIGRLSYAKTDRALTWIKSKP
jgi:flavin reductase (DIM6/NTAB) family NADH-FMN oxidoreductase RutF